MTADATLLPVEPLSAAAFAPYGEVIETAERPWLPINRGTTRRYHRLAEVEALGEGASAAISLFAGQAFAPPLDIGMLERHPLGSQCFLPMDGAPYLVVVAVPGGARPDEATLRAFVARGDQGVNYRAGTWHHPLLCLGRPGLFAVVDRVGPGANCDEAALAQVYRVVGLPALAGS